MLPLLRTILCEAPTLMTQFQAGARLFRPLHSRPLWGRRVLNSDQRSLCERISGDDVLPVQSREADLAKQVIMLPLDVLAELLSRLNY